MRTRKRTYRHFRSRLALFLILGCLLIRVSPGAPKEKSDVPMTRPEECLAVIDGIGRHAAFVELADGKIVGVNGGEIANQCLAAGLLDEVWIDLVPVLLGGGTRLFPDVPGAPALLDLVSVLEDEGVTHLRYRVRRDG